MSRRDDQERKRRERERKLRTLAATGLLLGAALALIGSLHAPRLDVVATVTHAERGMR